MKNLSLLLLLLVAVLWLAVLLLLVVFFLWLLLLLLLVFVLLVPYILHYKSICSFDAQMRHCYIIHLKLVQNNTSFCQHNLV